MDTPVETQHQEQKEQKEPHHNSIWKTIGLYLVKIIHLMSSLLVLVGPFLTDNVLFLTFIIMYCLGCYYFWYQLGYCFCTSLEEYLGEPPTKYEDGTKKSFIATTMQQLGIPESFVSNMFSTIPAVSALICMYKINIQYKKITIFQPESLYPTFV